MPAMTVSITDRQQEFVETEVASGGYRNSSEVVREALRLLEYQKREREAKLRDLRAAIDDGDTSGDAEPLEDVDIFFTACRRPTGRSPHLSNAGSLMGRVMRRPRAQHDLDDLWDMIADEQGQEVANRFLRRVFRRLVALAA
jgi:antitoxin ParD1/3/4